MTKRVLYLQYANPGAYPPLEHSSRMLAREGWAVFFLGVRARATEKLLLRADPSITVRLMPGCEPGWRQKLHYLRFVAWSLYSVIRRRPRWLYASDLFSCPAALLLSFLPGLKVVYHEHDFHAVEKGSGFLRLCNQCRKFLARRAETCVVPNDQRAELFKQENPEAKVVCVWNCPLLEEVALPRMDQRSDDFWLLYHGSIVPLRLPRTVIQALKPLPPNVKLRVIGYEPPGHEGYTRELDELANTLGLSDRVQFLHEVAERSELLAWTRRSHVGLAFVPRFTSEVNMTHMTGASNKPFDYLANGLALLVSDVADWRKMFVEPGYAMACDQDSVDGLTTALGWFYDHREETGRMGEKGRQQIIAAWHYEARFAPVLAQMNGNADAVSVRFEAGKISEIVS